MSKEKITSIRPDVEEVDDMFMTREEYTAFMVGLGCLAAVVIFGGFLLIKWIAKF